MAKSPKAIEESLLANGLIEHRSEGLEVAGVTREYFELQIDRLGDDLCEDMLSAV